MRWGRREDNRGSQNNRINEREELRDELPLPPPPPRQGRPPVERLTIHMIMGDQRKEIPTELVDRDSIPPKFGREKAKCNKSFKCGWGIWKR